MSAIGDFVRGVVTDVLQDMLRKASTSKRSRRRKRSTSSMTAAERLSRLERMIKPAKRQASRRKTVRSRSKAKRRSY